MNEMVKKNLRFVVYVVAYYVSQKVTHAGTTLAPNMATTRIWAPLLLAILINFKLQFYSYIFLNEDFNSVECILRGNGSLGSDDFGISL